MVSSVVSVLIKVDIGKLLKNNPVAGCFYFFTSQHHIAFNLFNTQLLNSDYFIWKNIIFVNKIQKTLLTLRISIILSPFHTIFSA